MAIREDGLMGRLDCKKASVGLCREWGGEAGYLGAGTGACSRALSEEQWEAIKEFSNL